MRARLTKHGNTYAEIINNLSLLLTKGLKIRLNVCIYPPVGND